MTPFGSRLKLWLQCSCLQINPGRHPKSTPNLVFQACLPPMITLAGQGDWTRRSNCPCATRWQSISRSSSFPRASAGPGQPFPGRPCAISPLRRPATRAVASVPPPGGGPLPHPVPAVPCRSGWHRRAARAPAVGEARFMANSKVGWQSDALRVTDPRSGDLGNTPMSCNWMAE